MTRIHLRDVVAGCEPGRPQTVANMQVVPLLSRRPDPRFVPPDEALVSTAGYGSLVVRNPKAGTLLVPVGATYIVEQAAQNHALPHVALVDANGVKQDDRAMCVQQGQGGYIAEGRHALMILPLPLREKAHAVRRESGCARLWGDIATFNTAAGLDAGQRVGHLEYFFARYRDELDGFAAQFEPVPDQIGCVVLLNGRVAGIERTPSADYYRAVWRPLVRECYGSLALVEPAAKPAHRAMRSAASRGDLLAALREAEQAERTRSGELLARLADVAVAAEVDEQEAFTTLATKGGDFSGQAVLDGDRVVYASLVTAGRAHEWN